MCQKRSTTKVKVGDKIVRVDACLKNLIPYIDELAKSFDLIGCCCGHGRYPMTIVGRGRYGGKTRELLSKTDIPRKRNIYRLDSEGFYYIPEVKNLPCPFHRKVHDNITW